MMISLNENLPMTTSYMPIIHQLFLGLIASVVMAMVTCGLKVSSSKVYKQRFWVKDFWAIFVISGHVVWIVVCAAKWVVSV